MGDESEQDESVDEDALQEEDAPEESVEEERGEEDTDPDALSLVVARDKEWDRVNRYLAKNLGDIEGDDAIHYHECFVCRSFGSPGFIRMEPLSPEVQVTLFDWLNLRPPD